MAPQRIVLPEPALPRDDTGLRAVARDARTMLPRDERAYTDLNTQLLIHSLADTNETIQRAYHTYSTVGQEEKARLKEAKVQAIISKAALAPRDQWDGLFDTLDPDTREFARLVTNARQGEAHASSWSDVFLAKVQTNPTLYDLDFNAIKKDAEESRVEAIGDQAQNEDYVTAFDRSYNDTLAKANVLLLKSKADRETQVHIDTANREVQSIGKQALEFGASLPDKAFQITESIRLSGTAGIHPDVQNTIVTNMLTDLVAAGEVTVAKALADMIVLPSGKHPSDSIDFVAKAKIAEKQLYQDQWAKESHAITRANQAREEGVRAGSREVFKLVASGKTSGPEIDAAVAKVGSLDGNTGLSLRDHLASLDKTVDTGKTQSYALRLNVAVRTPGSDLDGLEQEMIANYADLGTLAPSMLSGLQQERANRLNTANGLENGTSTTLGLTELSHLIDANASYLVGPGMKISATGDVGRTQVQKDELEAINLKWSSRLLEVMRDLPPSSPASARQAAVDDVMRAANAAIDRAKKLSGADPANRESTEMFPKTDVHPLSRGVVEASRYEVEAIVRNQIDTNNKMGKSKEHYAGWLKAEIAHVQDFTRKGEPVPTDSVLYQMWQSSKNRLPSDMSFGDYIQALSEGATSVLNATPASKEWNTGAVSGTW